MHAASNFRQTWLAETIRLREAHSGPLHDSNEIRRVRAEDGDFPLRILRRASLLGQREKIDHTLDHWWTVARLSLAAMLFLAVLTGFGTAIGAMGDGAQPVNLLLVLVTMLGLHGLTLFLWLVGLTLRTNGGGAWLGRVWLDATRKLARGPDAALAPRALVGLLGRSGALRWSLSTVSHLLWLSALLSLLLTLLGLLSARRYSFNWETTLLTPDAFVAVTQTLGWLPALLGFDMPDEATIRLSDGLSLLPTQAQALWSSWLIGCIVVYGVVPRLAAFLVSYILARNGIRRADQLDTALPGYANLRPRLMPTSEGIAPDAAKGPDTTAHIRASQARTKLTGAPAIIGLELAPDVTWPPPQLSADIQNAGVVESREQRHAVLDQLHAQPVPRLLVVCDSFQTPDRGTLAYIAELAACADETRIAFYSSPTDVTGTSRTELWRRQLNSAGVCAEHIHQTLAQALSWLEGATA